MPIRQSAALVADHKWSIEEMVDLLPHPANALVKLTHYPFEPLATAGQCCLVGRRLNGSVGGLTPGRSRGAGAQEFS